MNLLKYEFKKIIFRRTSMVTILILITITLIAGFIDIREWTTQVEPVRSYNAMVEPYEGDIKQEVLERFDNKTLEYVSPSLSSEERREATFQIAYRSASTRSEWWNKKEGEFKEYPVSISGLSNLKSQLELLDQQDTFKYRNTIKKLKMMELVGEPGYFNLKGWNELFNFLTSSSGMLFISIVLAIALSPTFSDECVNKMDTLILSSKMGRHKIVAAKINASILFSFIFVTVYYIIVSLLYLIPTQNLTYGNKPLNSIFYLTPYNWSVLETLVYSYLMALVGAFAIAMICCLISVIFKNNIASMACCLGLLILIPLFSPENGLLGSIIKLFPIIALQGTNVFGEYTNSYNLFGWPVIWPIAILVSCFVLMILSLTLTHKIFGAGKLK